MQDAFKGVGAVRSMAGRPHRRVAESPVGLQLRFQARRGSIRQVGLVEGHRCRQARPLGGSQVAVADREVRCRSRCDDRHQLIEIGDDNLARARRTDARQFGDARLDADDQPGGALRILLYPGHSVAAYDVQAPAKQSAGMAIARGVLDDDAAPMSRHDAPRQFPIRPMRRALHPGPTTPATPGAWPGAAMPAVWFFGSMVADGRDCSLC